MKARPSCFCEVSYGVTRPIHSNTVRKKGVGYYNTVCLVMIGLDRLVPAVVRLRAKPGKIPQRRVMGPKANWIRVRTLDLSLYGSRSDVWRENLKY